jgi:hypothetical protein
MTAPKFSQDTDHGRFYFHPDGNRSVPSITNIKGVKNFKAAGAVSAKECATYASKNRAMLATLDEDDAWRLVRGAPYRHDTPKNIASRVGDIVHDWIDMRIQGEKVNPLVYVDKNTGEENESPQTARRMWRAFLQFEEVYTPKWLRSEFTVWSDSVGFAGTMDWMANISGFVVLGDNKTGKAVWPDMGIQLAAGAHADFILNADGSTSELPKFDKFGILHIRPQSFSLVPFDNDSIEARWEEFKALKTVFDIEIEWDDKSMLYAPRHSVRQPPKPKPPRTARSGS